MYYDAFPIEFINSSGLSVVKQRFISKKARLSWRLNFASCPPQRQERPEVQPGFSLDIYYPVKTPTTICIWRRPEDRTYSYESSGRCSIFRLNFLMFLV